MNHGGSFNNDAVNVRSANRNNNTPSNNNNNNIGARLCSPERLSDGRCLRIPALYPCPEPLLVHPVPLKRTNRRLLRRGWYLWGRLRRRSAKIFNNVIEIRFVFSGVLLPVDGASDQPIIDEPLVRFLGLYSRPGFCTLPWEG